MESPMLKNFLTLFGAPARRLIVLIVLANLLVLALIGLSLKASHSLYQERAAATSRNTNLLVSQAIGGEIERIDLGLRAVVDEYQRQRATGRIDRDALVGFLRKQQERLPMLSGLRIADAGGDIVYAPETALPTGISVMDRDYFKTLRDNPSAGLVISEPVLGKISGKWVLIFAHRLGQSGGNFEGVAFASVAIDWFVEKFTKLEVGPQGTVVLRGNATRNFDLLARIPWAGYVGQTKVSKQFIDHITANPESGTYEAHAGADNIRRTFSYQQIPHYPLITLVGLASQDVLADWWREVFKQCALMLAFVVMTVIGGRAVLRAWRARSEAYEQFRLLLTSAGVGIFGIDTQGTCTFCNPSAIKMLGYGGESDLLGKEMHPLISPTLPDGATPPREESRMLAALQAGSGGVHVANAAFRRCDGALFPVDYWSHPQYRGKRLVGAVVTFSDITERQKAEEALKQLNEHLEQRVAEELRKNREKDVLLIQQSRLAAMGEMIGNIAHQWRQPINALTLLLANIKDSYDFGELTREELDAQVKTGNSLIYRMSRTIDDFRSFFRPNKKKMPFSLAHALAGVKEILGASLGNHGIVLEEDIPHDITVVGYGNEFAQMLLNLVNNASDAIQSKQIPDGRIRVEMREEKDMAVVKIIDNGGGIPEEILPKIFDPYFTTKAKSSGTGIGLYMAKSIVENNMGGIIKAKNTGNGAEFIVSVPLLEDDSGEREVIPSASGEP